MNQDSVQRRGGMSQYTDVCQNMMSVALHDDVIKRKHFPRYWPFVRGIHQSPVNSPHKGQRRGALMFSLICARINGWVNNREAGDLRRHPTHCDVTVMSEKVPILCNVTCSNTRSFFNKVLMPLALVKGSHGVQRHTVHWVFRSAHIKPMFRMDVQWFANIIMEYNFDCIKQYSFI